MDTSYNDIPYMGRVHPQTHIERLALSAHIFGMQTPPLEQARILELGCGDGSNLVNMAINLPQATFVGIDGSSVHIDRARAMAAASSADNILFEAMDISDIHDQFGSFDFIICHGVFSWVPESVRDHILRICRELLTEFGIGYISYNAYPAWKQHEMLRDMMRFHAFRMDESKEQILQARALAQFLATHIPNPQGNSYDMFLRSQVDFISEITDEYLYHEYLEAYNQPFWFYEFIKLLDGNGLQYLGDTDLSSMINLHWPEETRDVLNAISPTQYELEQYMDMLRCRRFRCSLFVHHAREVTRGIEPNAFMDVYFSYKACAKWVVPEDESTVKDPTDIIKNIIAVEESSESDSLRQFVVLQHLHNQWPHRVHFNDLFDLIYDAEQTDPETSDRPRQRMRLATFLQNLYLQDALQIHLYQPILCNELPERPRINGVARYQATYQEIISTQLHDMILVRDEWVRRVVILMDGTRTLEDIINILCEEMEAGLLSPLEAKDSEGEDITDPLELQAILAQRMQKVLLSFLEHGVFL